MALAAASDFFTVDLALDGFGLGGALPVSVFLLFGFGRLVGFGS